MFLGDGISPVVVVVPVLVLAVGRPLPGYSDMALIIKRG